MGISRDTLFPYKQDVTANATANATASMPKHRQKKYRDNDRYADDVEMNQRGDSESESSEEEITVIHENRKQRAKRVARETVERVKEEPKCRSVLFRYCLFLVVLSLGVGMVVNLYGTYGEYVTDAIFPPRTSSAGVLCYEKDTMKLTNDYMAELHHFEVYNSTNDDYQGWAIVNATMPKENLLMAWTTAKNPVGDANDDTNDDTNDDMDTDAPSLFQEMVDIKWQTHEALKVWIPDHSQCVAFIVWSI